MALAGLADLHRNLPIKIGVAAAVLVSLGGIAALVVPETTCLLSGSARSCGTAAVATPVSPAGTDAGAAISPVPASEASAELSPAAPARPPPPAAANPDAVAPEAPAVHNVAASVATPEVTQPASTPAAAGLIDTTFELLDATAQRLEARAAAAPEQTVETVAATAGTAEVDTASEPGPATASAGPIIREVRTTPVHADIDTGAVTYGPVPDAPAEPDTDKVALAEVSAAAASAASGPEVSPMVEETAPAPAAAPQDVPVPKPAPKAFRAKAQTPVAASPAPADVMVVAGQGANVRASPTSSASRLFAIRGGEKVTVLKHSKGWNEIADSRGRRGWIWSRMLVRPNG